MGDWEIGGVDPLRPGVELDRLLGWFDEVTVRDGWLYCHHDEGYIVAYPAHRVLWVTFPPNRRDLLG